MMNYPKMNVSRWCLLGLTLAGFLPSAFAAANSIKDLQISQAAGVTILKLVLQDAPETEPGSFSIAQPARIAFDFADTTNELGRNSQLVNQGDLRSVNVVQAGERTRLVLNLNRMQPYETRLEGNVYYVTLAAAAGGAAVATTNANDPAAVSHFATVKTPQAGQSLKAIDFRRGKNGEGRVIVELPDPNVGIDLQKQGRSLLVTFKKMQLPRELSRLLDVTDFATPVSSVNTQVQGENVVMTITPHGPWEHNAYQSDHQFVVEVRPLVEQPNQLVEGSTPGAHGEKLSLNFQNIEVRAVLQVIADFTNYNIITSDSVTGNVTLRLKDVPWDQALDIILQSKSLGMRKNGNVIWIAPDKEIIARDEYQSRSRQASSISEPMQTQSFRLSYARAEDISRLLTGESAKRAAESKVESGTEAAEPKAATAGERGNYLSASGAVTLDTRTNQLFVTDYPQNLERIKKLITQVDQPVRQVLIEARIVSAEDNFGRSLGVRLGYNDLSSTIPGRGVGNKLPGTSSTYGSVSGTLEGVFTQTGQDVGGGRPEGKPASLAQSTFVNLPAMQQGGTAPSTFAISLFKTGLASFINLELQAAETDGRLKSIASPRVVTADAQPALIAQGVEVPYVVTTNNSVQTIFKKAELRLSVTPQITSDGTVILDLDVSNDEVGVVYADGNPSINTKNIKTKVTVDNGGTVVLGGVYQQAEQQQTNKVPFLGDLPVVGHLFKSDTRSSARKELLVFITPKIMDEQIQATLH